MKRTSRWQTCQHREWADLLTKLKTTLGEAMIYNTHRVELLKRSERRARATLTAA